MVALIRSDLEFILEQILIAEAHAAGRPLSALVPDPSQPLGLRTVDGTWNNLVEGQSKFGAADTLFPRATAPTFGAAEAGTSYAQNAGTVIDSEPRTISNLISDQTSTNDAAVAAAIAAGDAGGGVPGGSLSIPNVAPDAGLSAPFNGWMTLFGQFFDHGLDLVTKGGSGTVFIPLKPDDPLYSTEPGAPNFMVLTRATNRPGADGVLGTADDVHEHLNTTTSFVDQNQTYTSHPSHQVFLREYAMADGKPLATGKLLEGVDGGLATWGEIKAQARQMLGIDLTDHDVTNIPLLATDPYGEFIRGPNGYVQVVTKGADGLAGTADDTLVEGNPAAPVNLADAVRTGHAFLDDIAHNAAPFGRTGALAADGDTVVNPADSPSPPPAPTTTSC